LRDRMKLVLRFEFYSVGELVEVLRQRSRGLEWAVEEKVFAPIARRVLVQPNLEESTHRVS
jgi:holliday junction DNA helicase RuvB